MSTRPAREVFTWYADGYTAAGCGPRTARPADADGSHRLRGSTRHRRRPRSGELACWPARRASARPPRLGWPQRRRQVRPSSTSPTARARGPDRDARRPRGRRARRDRPGRAHHDPRVVRRRRPSRRGTARRGDRGHEALARSADADLLDVHRSTGTATELARSAASRTSRSTGRGSTVIVDYLQKVPCPAHGRPSAPRPSSRGSRTCHRRMPSRWSPPSRGRRQPGQQRCGSTTGVRSSRSPTRRTRADPQRQVRRRGAATTCVQPRQRREVPRTGRCCRREEPLRPTA